eukprot:jgi/Undpi1/11225/HiC_scaffold_30.g13523.m1
MAVHRWRVDPEEKRGSFDWLQQAGIDRIPQYQAGMFELNDLDRTPLGNVGGAVKKLVDVSGLLLYAIEIFEGEMLMIFLQVPSVPEVFTTPFLDRGVRRLAETGSMVYVARLDAVEEMPGFVPAHKLSSCLQSRFSFVWNTGRCGSTLMHKMLQKLGVLSFSEPYWLDNIIALPWRGIGHDVIGRLLDVLKPWRDREAMGRPPPPKDGMTATIFSRAVEQALMSGDLVRPSNPLVSKLSLGWMQTLCLWKELHQVGVAKRGSTASLRMEDFTEKAGDLMAKSSHVAGSGKARFLTPTDVREIERVTAAVPHIGSPDYIVPGSMGAPAC